MKRTFTIASFSSCGGCKDQITNFITDNLSGHFAYKSIRTGDEAKINIGLVEGSIAGQEDIKKLRRVRKSCEKIIAVGSCANLGGIQSIRNESSKKLVPKESVYSVNKIVRVDYSIPGCPINTQELQNCLMDLYWGKTFQLPDLAVCFECKQAGNTCFLKKNEICLGPVTRMGCKSFCISNGLSCHGCRGKIETQNTDKLEELITSFSPEHQSSELKSIFGE